MWVNLIIATGQETNGDNLGMSFRSSIQYWYVECTHKNRLVELISMVPKMFEPMKFHVSCFLTDMLVFWSTSSMGAQFAFCFLSVCHSICFFLLLY